MAKQDPTKQVEPSVPAAPVVEAASVTAAEPTPEPVPDLATRAEVEALTKRIQELDAKLDETNARAEQAIGQAGRLLEDMRLSNTVKDRKEIAPVPQDEWRNDSVSPVKITLHSVDGHREIPMTIEPGESVRIPGVYRQAVRNAAPQLTLVI